MASVTQLRDLDFELFELLPDAILAVDQRGVIRYANRQAGQLFGQEPATLVSTSVEALLPEHLRERHIADRAKYALEPQMRPMGAGLDLVARRACGTTFPVDIMLNPLQHLAEPLVLAVVRDMTDRRAAEEQKQKLLMHDRLQLALDAAQLGWWHYDPLRGVVAGDTRFKGIFDVTADETPVEEIAKRLHPDDSERFWADREAALDPANPKPYTHQYRIRRNDGEVRWVETNTVGMPNRTFGVVRDITERKKTEDAQAHLAAIVRSSADAIVGKTLDGIVTSWNEAAERMFGYSAHEMIGQSIRRLIPADRHVEEDMILGRVARSESIVQYETKRVTKNGRTFDASVTISPVQDAEGRIVGAAKIIRDIAARKQAEELLRRQADLLDQSHDAIFTWKIGGGITYWSRGAERLYGYTAEEAIGRSSHELLRTRSPIPMQEVEAQIAHEGSWYGELTHTTREGRTIIVESRHVRVSYGGEIHALETNRDITARKRAEEALHESEERFRSSLLHSPLPVALFDDQEHVLVISETWLEQTGYSREELLRIEDWTARAFGDRSGEVLEYIREVMPTGADAHSLERIIRTKDGRERLWSFVTSALGTQSDGRRLFICVAQDVTERKAHEEQVHLLMREATHRAKDMQESRERLQFALDAAPLGWWQYDPIRGVVWWDTRLKEMFGIAEDWTDVEEFKRRVHPDDVERVWAAVEAATDPTNPVHYATEFRHRRGEEVRWTEAHALVHFEGRGRERRAVSMVGTAQDITQRKRHEEERKQHEERERLLMREVNHRAKNMLSVVATIARQTAAKNPEDFVERFLERIQALAANQDLLVRNEWRGTDVEDLIRTQLAHFADLVGSRIAMRGPKLRLNAAATQAIGMALHELATNAGKYGALSTDGGRVDICWGTDGDTLTMSWTERGGPPVSPPEQRGFGSTVIVSMAKATIGGEVQLDYAPSGLVWRLTCSAANALEPGGT